MEINVDFNKLTLEEKINFSKQVIKEAFDRYDIYKMAVAITGGKDSTLTLWLVREVCDELSIHLPKCIFIDEGDEFEKILKFVKDLEKKWNLDLIWLKNEDVLKNIKNGNIVFVKSLSKENQEALKEIGFKEPYFVFQAESYIGTHLMKIIPLKKFIIENAIQALITGVRWDEQEARRGEKFFSPRNEPEHMRVHPILHFTERDVWNTIHKYKIPYCPLYKLGYRSLGAKSTTKKVADIPAWEQDLENTSERAGRLQQKEKIMASLRELGYM